MTRRGRKAVLVSGARGKETKVAEVADALCIPFLEMEIWNKEGSIPCGGKANIDLPLQNV
jgi:hypothetical protein